MKKKKYNIGGELLQTGVQLGGNALLPGLGSVASMLLGQSLEKDAMGKQIQKNMQKVNTVANPYQFKKGGPLDGIEKYNLGGQLTGSDEVSTYKGSSHEQGGIGVNEKGVPDPNTNLEVEGREVRLKLPNQNSYIFSKSLKV